MARGWESKSVESQIEAAEKRRPTVPEVRLTPEQQQIVRDREMLLMTRVRVLHDLEQAQNPRYRSILEASLRHLDDKIAALGGSAQA
jgi:hypothetical protein